jgi:hypothetical protein
MDSPASEFAKAKEAKEQPGPQASHASGFSAPANVDLVAYVERQGGIRDES